jgi:hypothetical protein
VDQFLDVLARLIARRHIAMNAQPVKPAKPPPRRRPRRCGQTK